MKSSVVETIAGFVVLIIAGSFLLFVYKTGYLTMNTEGYNVLADFQNIEGISKGADIKLAGIKIGTVEDIQLDDSTYYATIRLKINQGVSIPKDSTAIIATNGFLGGKYIKIYPGADDGDLASGDKIKFTQSALNFEELVSKLIYSMTSKKS